MPDKSTKPLPLSDKTLISPEVLVPRLGEQLVLVGLLTEAQLKKALDYQRLRAAEGRPSLLGESIIELGFIDRVTLDRAITEQIIRLRAALEDANRNLEYRVQQRTAELEEALRKLSEINQLKANFIANVSHELRTPLTHIRGYLELLGTESLGSLNEDQQKGVDVSMRAADRLQNLIDDLILFSLAARGEMTLALKPVDLNRVISSVLIRANQKADDQKIDLKVDVDPALPFVQADEEKLSWVLSQLLDNALKFTQSDGKVRLSAKLEDQKMVNIMVSDTGIGIPPEHIKEIFEPFHQLDGSATRRFGGTGLGLALVRQIVESHGSLINVRSDVNKGTTITFPLLVDKNAGTQS
jgi:signal transduction histidine kinase